MPNYKTGLAEDLTGGPGLIVPPASCLQSATSVAWFTATAGIVHRFWLPCRAAFRYVNVPIGTSSGNIQAGVVALSGANRLAMTKVMDSTVIASPGTGVQRIDCGNTILPPGDYGVFFWADNTTIQVPHVNATGLAGTRWSSNSAWGSGLVNGTLPSWGQRVLIGLNLEADV